MEIKFAKHVNSNDTDGEILKFSIITRTDQVRKESKNIKNTKTHYEKKQFIISHPVASKGLRRKTVQGGVT